MAIRKVSQAPTCSNVHSCRGLSLPLAARKPYLPYRLPQGNPTFFIAFSKEAKPSFPLQLTDPYRLEGTTFADRLAAGRNYEHS